MTLTGRIKVQGVSPVERLAKGDRNEGKGEFLAACEIEKKIVRAGKWA